jgi:hypothetical protein
MFGPIGVPELLMLPILILSTILPLAVGIWAVFTLHRVRTGQEAMRAKLESIEQLLHRA